MDTDTCTSRTSRDTSTDLANPAHLDAPIDMASIQAASLTNEQLEERLCLLAGRLAVTEAEFLRLLVELDQRGIWAHLGLRSAARWLSWRLGMGLGAAREKVRVAHALQQLPAVAAAFGEATLSFSQVRALTRVATPVNEAELLELAHGATGAQLERIARAWRRVLVEETSASATLTRSWRRRVMDDGSVIFTLHVPADDAAVLLAESFCATGAVGSRGDGLEVVLYADLASLLPPDLDQGAEEIDTAPPPQTAEQSADRDVSPPPPRPSGVVGSHGSAVDPRHGFAPQAAPRPID